MRSKLRERAMADVVKRVAVRNWFIEAENGDRQEIYEGKAYTTTRKESDDHVTVLNKFWVKVPLDVFAPLTATQQCPHCSKHFVTSGDQK